MTWPYGAPPEPYVRSDRPSWACPGEDCQCHAIKEGSGEEEVSVLLLAHDGARMPGARARIHYQGAVVNEEDAPNADGDARVKVKLPRLPTTLLVEWAPADTPNDPRYPYRAQYYVNLAEQKKETGRRRLSNLGFWLEGTLEDNVRAFQRRYDHPQITGDLDDIEPQLKLFHDQGCPPVTHDDDRSVPSLDKGTGGNKSSFVPPSEQNAKQGEVDKPTPQQPVGPAQNQGSVKVPSNPVEVDLVIDWGHRPARAGKAAQASTGFWLKAKTTPITVGSIDVFARWPIENIADGEAANLPTETLSSTSVAVRKLKGPLMFRVDFELDVTIGNETATVLAFRQLYFLMSDGELLTMRFAFEDYAYTKGTPPKPPAKPDPSAPPARKGAPPERTAGKGKFAQTHKRGFIKKSFRVGMGLHPLIWHEPDSLPPTSDKEKKKKGAIERVTKRIFVNAEFVDATDLWWKLHSEEEHEQYLHPALLGRSEFLRILAWTSGKLPMIWFAVVPDAALENTEKAAADIVFYRPPPEANSFDYKTDESGFTDERHHHTVPKFNGDPHTNTMYILARYLLGPRPLAVLEAAGVTEDVTLRAFADQIQPWTARDASGVIDPALPAPHISGFPTAFYPCSLEDGMNSAKAPHVLFLPLGSDIAGYPGAIEAGLKTLVDSALLCLWNQCGFARDLPNSEISENLDGPGGHIAKPSTSKRKLWVVGHSAGNLSMRSALIPNAADIERVITISATPPGKNLEPLTNTLTSLVAARGKKTTDVFVLSAPDMTGNYVLQTTSTTVGTHKVTIATEARGSSMDVGHASKLVATKAQVTFLPAFDKQRATYTLAPAKDMNVFLHKVVGQWTDQEIEISAANPRSWNFLFFHEYPMFARARDSRGQLSTYFQQALGAPSPLTTVGSTLPEDAPPPKP